VRGAYKERQEPTAQANKMSQKTTSVQGWQPSAIERTEWDTTTLKGSNSDGEQSTTMKYFKRRS
jgi:hypothetical protein